MIIYIVRHGEAEPKSGKKGDDDKRRLTPSGAASLRLVLGLAKQLGAVVDEIFSSPILRAKESAKIAADVFCLKGFKIMNSLEPITTPYEIYGDLSKLRSSNRVMLVSHQPLVSSLISDLLGSDANVAMPTGSMARIDTKEELPSGGSGTLVLLLSSLV